jgi:hypothetical protein
VKDDDSDGNVAAKGPLPAAGKCECGREPGLCVQYPALLVRQKLGLDGAASHWLESLGLGVWPPRGGSSLRSEKRSASANSARRI